MHKGEVVRAVNDNIEPIPLTREEVLDTRIKNFEMKDLNIAMMEYSIVKEAEKLVPIFSAEVIVREMKLGKKIAMWSNEQYKEFEDYFANKYINNKIVKGAN